MAMTCTYCRHEKQSLQSNVTILMSARPELCTSVHASLCPYWGVCVLCAAEIWQLIVENNFSHTEETVRVSVLSCTVL